MNSPQNKTAKDLINMTLDTTIKLQSGDDIYDIDFIHLFNEINKSLDEDQDMQDVQVLQNAIDSLFDELKKQRSEIFERLTTANLRATAHKAYISSEKR